VSECIDKKFEKQLYAYELGMLTEEEAQEVERHLYACEDCFNQAREFRNVVRLLHQSDRVRSQIRSDATGRRITKMTRLLIAAVAVVALAFPAYRLLFESTSTPTVQSLYLVPFRDNSATVLDLNEGGTAEIRFVIEGANVTDTHSVVISRRNGPTVYSDDAFAGFNQFGQGTVSLPVNRFDKGYYVLTVFDSKGKDTLTLAAYPFRVE